MLIIRNKQTGNFLAFCTNHPFEAWLRHLRKLKADEHSNPGMQRDFDLTGVSGFELILITGDSHCVWLDMSQVY